MLSSGAKRGAEGGVADAEAEKRSLVGDVAEGAGE